MKVVILCGGEGTRLREETEYKPKPMVTVGGIPLLIHIMKYYSNYGYKDFVLCLGYKGEMIREFFLDEFNSANDVILQVKDGQRKVSASKNYMKDWNIIFANTGLKAQTGARVKKIEKYIDTDDFFVTYGDGVSNVNLPAELELHKKTKAVVTLTGVHPRSKYGSMEIDGNIVTNFVEKPVLKDYINGGFYIFNKKIFEHLKNDDSCVLETSAFVDLAKKKKIAIYKHEDFWFSVDTYKEYLDINTMWDKGTRPWWKE